MATRTDNEIRELSPEEWDQRVDEQARKRLGMSGEEFERRLNAGEIIQRVVERDSPTWSPGFVDHLVGDRIHRELMDFTDKVRRNPDHELRRSATRFLFEFADDLQHDPDTITRAEAVKEQLMARDEIANAAAFLASSSSSFTTGMILNVDGGRFVRAGERALTKVYGGNNRATSAA